MEDADEYEVVINDEEQYSIWLANKEVPEGWRAVGCRGPKVECIAYIEKHWVDMRPLSVRSGPAPHGTVTNA